MKVLFVCRFLPHAEARDSGRLDTYRYLEGLSHFHDVSLISYLPAEEDPYVPSLQNLCEHLTTIPYFEHRLADRLLRLAYRQLFTRVYGRVFSWVYRRALQKMIADHQFDLIIVDGMMGLYTRWMENSKVILDEVDLFSHMAYQEYLHHAGSPGRWHLWQDWLRTTHKEHLYLQRVDGIWVRSNKDKVVIRDLHPSIPLHVIQPWFEGLEGLKSVSTKRPAGQKILFMGAMNLPSNIQAAKFFAQSVLPIVRKTVPDAEFVIVGSRPSPEVQALAHDNGAVTVTGEVADLTPYYETCAVAVVPLFVGGGIIVKTLNALAAGRPVVATSLGNSGTGAIPGKQILIEDPVPEQFAAAVIQLLTDEKRWNTLAKNGRQLIAQEFDWHQSIEKLNRFILDI